MKKRTITVNWYYTQLDEVESLLNHSLNEGYQLVELTKKRVKLMKTEPLLGTYHLKFFGKKTTEEVKEAFVKMALDSGYQVVDQTMGNVYVFYSANRSRPYFFNPNEEESEEIGQDSVTWKSFYRMAIWVILMLLSLFSAGRYSSSLNVSSYFYLATLTVISIYELYILLHMSYLLRKKRDETQGFSRVSLYLKAILDQGNGLFFLIPVIVGFLQSFNVAIYSLSSRLLISLFLVYVLYRHVQYRRQLGVARNTQVSLVLLLITISLGVFFQFYTRQIETMEHRLQTISHILDEYYEGDSMLESNHRLMFTGVRVTRFHSQNQMTQVTVVYPFNEYTPVNLLDDWIEEALRNPNALSSSKHVLVHDHLLVYATNLGHFDEEILRKIAESMDK